MPHLATHERCHVCIKKIDDYKQRIYEAGLSTDFEQFSQPGVIECGRCNGATCNDHHLTCGNCDADFCVDCLTHHRTECK